MRAFGTVSWCVGTYLFNIFLCVGESPAQSFLPLCDVTDPPIQFGVGVMLCPPGLIICTLRYEYMDY